MIRRQPFQISSPKIILARSPKTRTEISLGESSSTTKVGPLFVTYTTLLMSFISSVIEHLVRTLGDFVTQMTIDVRTAYTQIWNAE